MTPKRLLDVVQKITAELNDGKKDFDDYLKWMQDEGLSEQRAKSLLDQILKYLEDK